MKLEYLRQADYCLSKCARPVPPDNATSVLYFPRGIPIQIQLGTGLSQTITRKVTGDADFELHSLSFAWNSFPTFTQLYFQVETPDGSDLFSALIDITQIAGFGANRYVLTKPLVCPLESRWILTFNTALPVAPNPQNVMVLFEGADRYVMTGGPPVRAPLAFAARWPRVGGDGNENILAPSWQQGFTLEPPPGYTYEPYMPVSVPIPPNAGTVLIPGSLPFVTLPITNSVTATQTAVIQVDQTNDLSVRRFLFDVQADAGIAAGRMLVRISAGSGYTLTEDYVDCQQTIGSSPLAKAWDVRAGDQIFLDLLFVVDFQIIQSGNVYFRAFADGVRKIRA